MKNIQAIHYMLVLVPLMLFQYGNKPISRQTQPVTGKPAVQVGADQLDLLLPKIKGKRAGLVVNHTAVAGKTHLIDTLKSLGVTIKKVFGPEHGFRGAVPDGEKIKDGVDEKTGLPVISLYGANRKPTPDQLADIDVIIFDIQDVGTRFYTFISTMHLVMEACAEQHKKMIILDRPNPNGDYIDGPVLEPELKSFVGMHPIPIVHGLTIGELATMISGEGWLTDEAKCDLDIIKIRNWTHNDHYTIPVKPSPNLPNDQAIRLYPSLCWFEGTAISVGRGTQIPFQILGNPLLKDLPFPFTPVSIPDMSANPPHKDQLCYGIDLRQAKVEPKINLQYLLDFYKRYPDKEKFFTGSFNRLAGTTLLQQQVKNGLSEEEIRKTWQPGLDSYKEKRKKYLLYP